MKLSSGSQVFRLLFNQEAIEIWPEIHCQNCLSDKDVMLKTTQPFYKFLWITSNIMKLFSGSQILGYFSIKKP